MSQRLVAIIDADLKLAGHLQAELQRYGITVEVAADSNELMARKEDLPELVVLCIDPKRTGWAVCNRLRKSPLLKTIPLIITSAEATEKDFDDHKKLKTRAEEYLHKPFSAEALIEKLGTLIGLPQIEAIPEEAAEIEVEAEEAVEIEAEEAMVEVAAADHAGQSAESDLDDEHTRVGFTAEIDGEVDLETNAAFAAIGLDEPAESAAQEGQGASPFDEDPFDLPDSPAIAQVAPASPPPTPVAEARAEMDSAPVPRSTPEDLGLDEVARDAEALVASTPAPASSSNAALEDARREMERLRKENEELRARPRADAAAAQSSSFSREREFLNLRETINKKEKEVLDLKDALDSKERQILDGKDKFRDAERRLREAEERSLGYERELVAAREKVEALGTDKERAVEREKQIKGRLEDTQKAMQRAEEEVEQWRAKHAADTTAQEERHTHTVAKHREEMGALRQLNAEALAELKTEHTAERSRLIEEHKQTVENEVRATERRHAEAVVDLEGKHAAALQAAGGRHQEALRAQAEEAKRTFEQAVADHGAERARLEADHARSLEELEAARVDSLEQAAQQAAGELAAAVEQRGVEAEAELKAAREQHARKLQALEESHEDLRAGMTARHAAATEELKRQHATVVADHEATLADRDQTIAQQLERTHELEGALRDAEEQARTLGGRVAEAATQAEALRAELDGRARTIEERARRIAELEQESARYQDQILRAYQRIKADESIVARAKKALAIALTLLEESDTDGPEEASS